MKYEQIELQETGEINEADRTRLWYGFAAYCSGADGDIDPFVGR